MKDFKNELNSLEPHRIGVLGGTFDPVHLGHLIMAQDAMERFDLDEVCLVPCASPPHKPDRTIATARHRLAMIESAMESDPRLSCSVIELERGGTSYTVDTMRRMKESCPEIELNFIIGGDTLFELYSWKDVDKLLEICTFIAVARPRFSFEAITAENLRLNEQQVEQLKKRIIVGHQVDISSSDIRMRIEEELSIRYLVPNEVMNYILEHNLYKIV